MSKKQLTILNINLQYKMGNYFLDKQYVIVTLKLDSLKPNTKWMILGKYYGEYPKILYVQEVVTHFMLKVIV